MCSFMYGVCGGRTPLLSNLLHSRGSGRRELSALRWNCILVVWRYVFGLPVCLGRFCVCSMYIYLSWVEI